MSASTDFDQWSPQGPVEELSDSSCWALLEPASFGRLAVSIDGQPQIFPVDYYASNPDILFRSADGTKLRELSRGSKIAFEVDHRGSRESWSIVVNGVARVITDPDEVAVADRAPLPTWIPTAPYTYVRITPISIRGRRFVRTLFAPRTETDH
jgi:nitroimidazol reductase NimA-like FMN-containing flavoprotein (pyridoxamine 5'-phosphate oxidase superfamily)